MALSANQILRQFGAFLSDDDDDDDDAVAFRECDMEKKNVQIKILFSFAPKKRTTSPTLLN